MNAKLTTTSQSASQNDTVHLAYVGSCDPHSGDPPHGMAVRPVPDSPATDEYSRIRPGNRLVQGPLRVPSAQVGCGRVRASAVSEIFFGRHRDHFADIGSDGPPVIASPATVPYPGVPLRPGLAAAIAYRPGHRGGPP